MRRTVPPIVRVLAGFTLLLVSIVPVSRAGFSVIERSELSGGSPLTLLLPDPTTRIALHAEEHTDAAEDAALDHPGERVPAVIVVHGFAASRQTMLGYGYTLAQAGYAVALVDLPGHGRSRLSYGVAAPATAIEEAYQLLVSQQEVDGRRIGLLGHSMGAAAVTAAAVTDPGRYRATVVVSPIAAPVTIASPRNLQLHAGTWEPAFLATAADMLARGGGANRDFAAGRARELVQFERASQTGIVFRTASHARAREWFDSAFEYRPAGRTELTDWRPLGWLLHVLGWLLVASALASPLRREPSREEYLVRRPLHWIGLVLAPVIATLIVRFLGSVVPVDSLAGIVVGGGLALWFLCAGTLYLVLAYRAGLPTVEDLIRGLGLFIFLWLAVGLTAHLTWLNWLMTPERLWRWPLLGLACVPWFTATEIGQGDPRGTSRLGWYLAQVSALVAALWWLAHSTPGMEVVAGLLPLLPIYMAILVALGAKVRRPWVYGVGSGLFFGWLLTVAFPILS